MFAPDPLRLIVGSMLGIGLVVGAGTALVLALATALVLGLAGRSPVETPFGPGGATPGFASQPSAAARSEIPPDQLAVMQQAAAAAPCPLDWSVLAAIARVESGFGSNMATSSAGAIGYGQFLPSTWAMPGIGNGGNPYDFHDALPAMARYLCQSGAGQDLHGALFGYNHDSAYVDQVLALAARYATRRAPTGDAELQTGWAATSALDQYDRRNYRSDATYAAWRDAACSAASLAWLLRVYGEGRPNIDDAIDLIGRNTAITTYRGLSDHTGSGLAAAVGRAGLAARRGQVRSVTELQGWLARGPLMLDGQTWFFAGHWFVATASDANGIFIHDSSGHDTRYLTWARLYGEVGFSGWVVGVDTAVAPATPSDQEVARAETPMS
jgi:hypothetical protein